MAKTKKQAGVLDRESAVAFGERLTGPDRERFCVTAAGRLYVGPIERSVAELKALVRDAAAPRVIVPSAMKELLRVHTAQSKVLWHGLSAIAEDTTLAPEVSAGASEVLAALGRQPTKKTRAATRVAQASAVRARLADLEAALARLPSPAGGGDFGARAVRWCDLGEGLTGELVGGALRGETARRPPGRGRGIAHELQRLNGLLNRARATLRDELADDATLPPTLETQLFTLYDELLEARRALARPKRAAAKPVAKPAAESPAVEPDESN